LSTFASAGRARIGYGAGVVELRESAPDPSVLERIEAAFASPRYEPPLLPAAALQLLELSRKPEVSFRLVLDVLERDPMLAARVLKIAQSPVYVSGEPIRSLEQALLRLGLETLVQIFLQASLAAKVFRAPGYEAPMEALRRHSVVTAHIARLVCRATALPDEYAYLCGLLHDVGCAAALIVLGQTSDKSVARVPYERARPAVLAIHEKATSVVCATWKLPAEVTMVIANHHHPVIGGHIHPMAAVVHVADALAVQLGEHGLGESPVVQEDVLKSMGLAGRAYSKLVADTAALVSKLRPG